MSDKNTPNRDVLSLTYPSNPAPKHDHSSRIMKDPDTESNTPRTDAIDRKCMAENATRPAVIGLPRCYEAMRDHARTLETELDAAIARAEKVQEDIEECLMSVCLGALPTTDTCEAVQRIQQAAGEARAELASLRKQLEAAKADVAYYKKLATPKTLDEIEAVNLRSIVQDQADDIANLRIELRCLCEKMEAGLGGTNETKRARALLEKMQ